MEYIPVPGGYPKGPARTPETDASINSFSNAAPILLFIYIGFVAVVFAIYAMLRRQAQAGRTQQASPPTRRRTAVSITENNAAAVEDNAVNGADKDNAVNGANSNLSMSTQDGDKTFIGYTDSTFGSFAFYCYQSVAIVLGVWYLIIIIDTYYKCEISGPDNLCFFGSRPLFGSFPVNSEVFFTWWCLAVAWAIFNFFCGKHVRNFFRIQTPFHKATYVACIAEQEVIVTKNPTPAVVWARQWLGGVKGRQSISTVEVKQNKSGSSESTKFIDFMCTRYLYASSVGMFMPASIDLPSSYSELRELPEVNKNEQKNRLGMVGPNIVDINVQGWLALIGAEFSSYLYLYQFMLFSVWWWFTAIIWGAPQMLVVLISALMNITIKYKNQRTIQKLTEYRTTCNVRRDGEWVEVSSMELVPGEIVQLSSKSDWILPCDLIILQGTCICDESGLTGESMSVRKSAIPVLPGTYDAEKDAKHTLFCGTTLLQAGGGENDDVIGIVSKTGIQTVKGELLSQILFPKIMKFQYDEELKIVFSLLVIYAVLLFIISLYLQLQISQLTWVAMFAFAAFTISQVLPPLLPVALTIGYTMSSRRLQEKQVFCVDPKRIAISGLIRVFCFDKTGTLTKQGLDFLGVHRTVNNSFVETEYTSKNESLSLGAQKSQENAASVLELAMSCCHSLTILIKDDKEELVGNQVEINMFDASGWSLNEATGTGHSSVMGPGGRKLTLERRFEFDHHTMSMTVVVRDDDGMVHVFCKGAPEKVGELCEVDSLPQDFVHQSRQHALEGCYVIGVSHKSLGNLSEDAVGKLTRDQVEVPGSLSFIGLLLFRNELKPDTAQAIQQLVEGGVRPVMVTGDNAQCAFYIAQKSNFVDPAATRKETVYLSELNGKEVVWKPMGSQTDEHISTDKVYTLCQRKEAVLAITGKALRVLTTQAKIEALVIYSVIFARVKPDQKVQVCQFFMDLGLITGMAGDGGNDCGALRAAHTGVALSDADASVVSPFTSASKSIQSIVDLVCEGRCALTTSFAVYKLYIMYGLNWSIIKTVNFAYGVRMPLMSYLTIDSICSWLVPWAITTALPLDYLLPYIPDSSLISPRIVIGLLLPWFVWMILMAIMLSVQGADPDHVDFPAQLTKGVGFYELGDSWESTIFTYFQVFGLIWFGICYSIGDKFRKSLFTNYWVICVWAVIFTINAALLFIEPNTFSAFFHVGSNAFNGFNTESPTWMRYQFPQGCPNINSTLSYNKSVGMGSWRKGLPNNCEMIAVKVKTCGEACLTHEPGEVSPGMGINLRISLFGTLAVGMVCVILFELLLNHLYTKKDPDWEVMTADKVCKATRPTLDNQEIELQVLNEDVELQILNEDGDGKVDNLQVASGDNNPVRIRINPQQQEQQPTPEEEKKE